MVLKTSASGFFPHTCPASGGGGIQRLHGRLPLPESIFYWITGIGSILYVTYKLFEASQSYLWSLTEDDFIDGWSFLGQKKDISNYEWNFWSGYFWNLLPWGVGHIIIARIVEKRFLHLRKPVFLTYSLVSVSYLLGYRTVLFFISHGCICYVASSVGSFPLVWVVTILLLSTLNYQAFAPIMQQLCGIPNTPEGYYLFIFVLALVILRYASFSLERSRYIAAKGNNSTSKEKTTDCGHFSMWDLLLYMFYFPLFFTGPLITYDKFKLQINSPPAVWTRDRVTTSMKGFVRVFFWAFYLELAHHYLYYNGLLHNITAVKEMSLWALTGIGYTMGQYFMVKYLVLYDLPGQVARLDNLDPPLGPKCISYIYRYSDMWKFFDRGLYTFLRNYIYIPLGGSQAGMLMQLLASLMCFLFIYVWHGEEYSLLLWSIFNYIGCSLELLVGQLEYTTFVSNIKASFLSPAMVRRLRCIIVVPLFLMSCLSVFYFFSGMAFGTVFLQRLIIQATLKSGTALYFLIYVNLQNAMEVERWLALKHKKE
ncbi:protein-cysteine N-palmitoyltransferase HHAT-like [Haliotis rufescens]|uniref:protein-cysteine N-palmitoyltransferase HHAT-like n=1 Tax=Haliotis rufescens TaxID=6454 RepID=UPI00201F5EFE|nr:protein-cysteine N-palmitoyltransferase HHAT-like [Haliotis rufescens]